MKFTGAWYYAKVRVVHAAHNPPCDASPQADKLSGIVEADETYVGGRLKNMHVAKQKRFKIALGVRVR